MDNFRWLCTQPLNASWLKNYFFCCYCCCCWGEIHLLPNSNSTLKLGTRFVIGWENNMDGDITMPLSLKTIGSAGYRDQWNKSFGRVLVNNKTSANNSYLGENALFSRIPYASGSCWKLFQTFLGQNGSENIVSVTNKAWKPRKALRFLDRSKLSREWIARKAAVKV